MKINIRKIAILILFIWFLFTLTSCEKTYNKLEHIYHKDIFSIGELEYYIYVYRPNCEVCSSIEELVCDYAKKAKRSKDMPHLYVLNKGDTKNNGDIYCSEEEFIDFVGATSITEIKTSSSPFLFKIKFGKVTATYDEKEEIINALKY